MNPSDFNCPECGADVSPNARGCKRCGARKEDGRWMRSEVYDGLGIDEDDFDYDSFIAEEFGGTKKRTPKETFWWVVAIIVLIAFVWLTIGGIF